MYVGIVYYVTCSLTTTLWPSRSLRPGWIMVRPSSASSTTLSGLLISFLPDMVTRHFYRWCHLMFHCNVGVVFQSYNDFYGTPSTGVHTLEPVLWGGRITTFAGVGIRSFTEKELTNEKKSVFYSAIEHWNFNSHSYNQFNKITPRRLCLIVHGRHQI